jgi:hypothetical protein
MRGRAPVLLVLALGLLAGCGGGSKATTTTTTTTAKAAAAGHTVWLCFPGKAADPCSSGLDTTVVKADGSTSLEDVQPAANPPIDCFYVYPTVSDENRGNADLKIQLPEVFVAEAQAERFSQDCKVYAPVYRQITNRGLTTPSLHARPLEAYDDVLRAWNDYLAHDNHGRGVVLIGHSQGAYILKHLVKTVVDRSLAERRLLVSAILLGGQVLGGNTPADTGDFTNVRPCSSVSDTGCVIAYSSFGQTPPAHARFGRDASHTTHVLCVNPASPGSNASTAVTPLFPSALLQLAGSRLGVTVKPVSTPWVAYPGLYTVQCRRSGTASWLQVTSTHVAGDTRPLVRPLFGAGWGLHATDVNIALANLVDVVAAEAKAYAKLR